MYDDCRHAPLEDRLLARMQRSISPSADLRRAREGLERNRRSGAQPTAATRREALHRRIVSRANAGSDGNVDAIIDVESVAPITIDSD